MNWKKFITLGVLVFLLVSTFGTVAAQSGVTPTVEPSVAPTGTNTEIEGTGIKVLHSSHCSTFRRLFWARNGAKAGGHRHSHDHGCRRNHTRREWTPVAGSTATPVPGTELVEGETQAALLGEEIAAYHEAGMGFGVLVKLYAMAEASTAACVKEASKTASTTPVAGATVTATAACVPASVDELVTAFTSGTGMGQLFKEYGKPALLGVGHVRKEAAKLPAAPAVSGTLQTTPQTTLQATPLADAKLKGAANAKAPKIPKIKPNHSTGNGKNK